MRRVTLFGVDVLLSEMSQLCTMSEVEVYNSEFVFEKTTGFRV